jgi:hypothetical protein
MEPCRRSGFGRAPIIAVDGESDRSGRLWAGLVGGRSLHGSVDIAVDVVGPDSLQYSIPVQGRRNRWLDPSKPEGEPGLLSKTGDFRHLR